MMAVHNKHDITLTVISRWVTTIIIIDKALQVKRRNISAVDIRQRHATES